MSGNLVLPDGRWWTASSGVYHWVVDHLAGAVTDPAVAERFRQTAEHGFRTLDLGDLPPAACEEVLRVLRDSLLPTVEARFPGPDGEAVRESVARSRDLARP
ncbi:hypothetical protein Amsp01_086520 [Amycolatopsis sp. NBRC 101858]|uniref:hypothetical protein n=1 Tax=Amycolatopsis sp. NBRC 101858 TaxID=3032200 RepID=UPI0024A1F25A|nr:hypothetical protein [Amycolatopsis sp. NBRC 101858]GLY42629.1 hypothetical protein Amsp01_086520 [Amycolatopsis sp. NBRC 101858]